MMVPLALTMGDPAGIGGEITAAAWEELRGTGPAFCLLGDPDWISKFCPSVETIDRPAQANAVFHKALPVISVPLSERVHLGVPDVRNAPAVIRSIEQSVELALLDEVGGVVTNPVSKSVLYQAGFRHPGHTEFIAALADCTNPVMMLLGPELRVVPVTVHVSLRQAIASLSTEAIIGAGLVAARSLRRDFGIHAPRIAVAGLNPHAGEAGSLGDEEEWIVTPAVNGLRAMGIDACGPLPADTMFTAASRATYDVALCMYHDQALIPLKTIDVENSVNITLGLPIVRTSPDHGTAFDIAGSGCAMPGSLIAAIRLAGMLRERRK